MTREESILISAYTGFFLTKDFSDVHALCEKVLGRPIFSHEFAAEEVHAEIREKLRPMIAELRCDDETVKHGYWVDIKSRRYPHMHSWYCSACDTYTSPNPTKPGYNYCPECGTKMDEPEMEVWR